MNKQKKKVSTVVIAVISISIISFSLAYFTPRIINGTLFNTTGVADDTLADISITEFNENVTLTDTFPMKDAVAEALVEPYSFKIKNKSYTTSAKYEIVLEVKSGSSLNNDLVSTNIGGVLTGCKEVSASTPGYEKAYIIQTGELAARDKTTVNLKIYINEDGTIENAQNKTWTGKIVVRASAGSESTAKIAECLNEDGTDEIDCPETFRVGDRIIIGTEQFRYIGETEDGNSIKLFAEYNLNINGKDGSGNLKNNYYGETADGWQNENVRGLVEEETYPNAYNNGNYYGTTAFSKKNNTYEDNSLLKEYIEGYATKINDEYFNGENIVSSVAITKEDLESTDIGCNIDSFSCSSAPSWVTNTSYWLKTWGSNGYELWSLYSNGDIECNHYLDDLYLGVRPVIILPKTEI